MAPTDLMVVLGLVRRHLYVPDSLPPTDWSINRDATIAKQILARKPLADLTAAIEGLALLRDQGALSWLTPGAKCTLRALYTTKQGVRPVFLLAQEATYQKVSTRTVRVNGTEGLGQAIQSRMRSWPGAQVEGVS